MPIDIAERRPHRPWGNLPPEARKYTNEHYDLENLVQLVRISKKGGTFSFSPKFNQEVVRSYLERELPKAMPGKTFSIKLTVNEQGKVFQAVITAQSLDEA